MAEGAAAVPPEEAHGIESPTTKPTKRASPGRPPKNAGPQRGARRWIPQKTWGLPRVPKLGTATSWALLIFLLSHQGRSTLWQITRLLGSAADMTQSGSHIVGAALDGGANVTTAVATLMVTAASSTMSLGTEAWRGVDLMNITIRLAEGVVAGDSGEVVLEWLDSGRGRRCTNYSDEMRTAARDVLETVGVSMPHVTAVSATIPLGNAFVMAVHEGRLLASGYIMFRFQMINASYTPVWANPVWEWAGIEPESEAAQIEDTLRALMAKVPGRQELPTTDALLATGSLPILVPARAKRWARWAWLNLQAVVASLWVPPWDW